MRTSRPALLLVLVGTALLGSSAAGVNALGEELRAVPVAAQQQPATAQPDDDCPRRDHRERGV